MHVSFRFNVYFIQFRILYNFKTPTTLARPTTCLICYARHTSASHGLKTISLQTPYFFNKIIG